MLGGKESGRVLAGVFLPTAVWNERRAALASADGHSDEWVCVADAFAAIDAFNMDMGAYRSGRSNDDALLEATIRAREAVGPSSAGEALGG
jgi:hypothetical protein